MSKVLLTGSSGNLGTYILNSLIQSSNIDRIWCLNRSSEMANLQPNLLLEHGLSADIPSHISFHRSDISSHDLGLSEETYSEICQQATHILHTAWPVDWNKSFESFTPSLHGVRNLINLANQSTNSPLLFFVSSVAAAGNWGTVPGAREQVPEEEVEDWKVARMGYGQSKLVAERLLADAARSVGVKTAVCRVGQVSGPVRDGGKGVWPKQEWVPSLIASSKAMAILPRTLGPAEGLDWVPVDSLAEICVELLLGEHQPAGTLRVHHVANPHVVAWEKMMLPTVKASLESGSKEKIEIKELPEWVEELERSAEIVEGDALERHPAVKLLSFFQNLKDKAIHLPKARAVRLEIKKSVKRSSKLADLEGVNERWVALWMQQWHFD